MKKPQADPYATAIAHLIGADRTWQPWIARVGPCRLEPETRREPYAALVHAVAHQQLHGRAAQAILGRFLALYPGGRFPAPEQILQVDDAALRACGFSLSKITAIRDIAQKAAEGLVPSSRAARGMSDEELIERLIVLRGVGRWTVEMLLIHTLGRPDVLPVDDFGVREGWRVVKGLAKQPTRGEMGRIGAAWSPYRSIAAWYLWRALELSRLPALAPPLSPSAKTAGASARRPRQ